MVGARVLPPDEFGALSWALSWLTFLAVLAQFGLTQVATIAVAQQERRTHGTLLAAAAPGAGGRRRGHRARSGSGRVGPATAAAGTPPAAYRPLVLLVTLVAAGRRPLGPVLVNVLRARDRFGLALVFGEHVRRVVLVAVLLVAAAGLPRRRRRGPRWSGRSPSRPRSTWPRRAAPGPRGGPRGSGRHAAAGSRRTTAADAADGTAGRPGGSPWRLLRSGSTFTLATLASVTVPQAGVWLLAVVAPVEEVAVFSVAVRIAVLVAVPTAIGMRTLAPRIAAALGYRPAARRWRSRSGGSRSGRPR